MNQVLVSPGRDALGAQQHREVLSACCDLAGQDGVVPGLAGRHAALAVRALGDDLRKQGPHVGGIQPKRSGRCSTCMPRSPRQPYSPLNCIMRFQLMGLLRVQVAGVPEPGLDLDDLAETAFAHEPDDLVGAGKEGNSDEQRAKTSGCSARAARIGSLAARSMPKGFSPSRCLPARMMSRVDLGVQVVRHGAVDGVDVGLGQQLAVVGRRHRGRRTGSREPAQARLLWRRPPRRVCGRKSRFEQMRPARVALANSRPISPQPMTPKRMICCLRP